MNSNQTKQAILVPENNMDTAKTTEYISLFTEDGKPVLTSTPNQVGLFGSTDFRKMDDGAVASAPNGDGIFSEALFQDFAGFVPNGVPAIVSNGAFMPDLDGTSLSDPQATLAYLPASSLFGDDRTVSDLMSAGRVTSCIHIGEPRLGSPRPVDVQASFKTGMAWFDPINSGALAVQIYVNHLVSGIPKWGYIVTQIDSEGTVTTLVEQDDLPGVPMGAWAITLAFRDGQTSLIVWRRGKIVTSLPLDIPWGTMKVPAISTASTVPTGSPTEGSGLPITWVAFTDGVPLTHI